MSIWHYLTVYCGVGKSEQCWMVSSSEELRRRWTRKDLKAVTKMYKTSLAEDHETVVPNCIASAVLLLQRLALPMQLKEAS